MTSTSFSFTNYEFHPR